MKLRDALWPWAALRRNERAYRSLDKHLADSTRKWKRQVDGLLITRNGLEQEVVRLGSLVRQLTPGEPEGAMDGIEFIIVGRSRGSMGKRLYASRNIRGARFGMTDGPGSSVAWTLAVNGMDNVLFIDKPDYAQALDHMSAIWRNWERDERATRATQHPVYSGPALAGERRALPAADEEPRMSEEPGQ